MMTFKSPRSECHDRMQHASPTEVSLPLQIHSICFKQITYALKLVSDPPQWTRMRRVSPTSGTQYSRTSLCCVKWCKNMTNPSLSACRTSKVWIIFLCLVLIWRFWRHFLLNVTEKLRNSLHKTYLKKYTIIIIMLWKLFNFTQFDVYFLFCLSKYLFVRNRINFYWLSM